MAQHSWSQRSVPAPLVARYEQEGWWTDDTLGAKVAEWLAAVPDATVNVHSRTNEWHGTYADIDDEARRLIALLRAEGIEPGAVVAFQLPNWREAVVSFVALAMGGYVLVPIVHIYGRKEVALHPHRVRRRRLHRARRVRPRRLHRHRRRGRPRGFAPPRDGRRRRRSARAGRHPPRRLGFCPLVRAGRATCRPAPADEVAVLAYTSGTTSDPKGVIHDHRTMLSELRHMNGWVAGRATLMGSPITHATGMLGAVLGPLGRGGDIHVIDRWDPGHALDVMAAYDISGGTGASIFLATLLDHPDFTPAHAAKHGTHRPRRRTGAGELGRRAERLGIKIIRAYGSTEHPSTTGSQFDDPADQRHTTDGPVLPGVEIRLVDPDGAEVPDGVAGEILSRGPELCFGYTNPALNDAFDDEGWYHTGDIGVVDEHGCLTITDRVKDIIIRGGENLSAAEIENAIAGVPGIAEVAVVAAPDARLGEHACAVVRMASGTDPIELADLLPHLEAAGLARQKWPEELRVVTDFPRTASGKVRKVDLRASLRE